MEETSSFVFQKSSATVRSVGSTIVSMHEEKSAPDKRNRMYFFIFLNPKKF